MRVVSNTSPISNLAVIGRLDILRSRFGKVVIPPAVARELDRLSHEAGRTAIAEAKTSQWLCVEELTETGLADALGQDLDPGEAEAIAAASKPKADLLVMDETVGRAVARRMGIPMTGTLGLLLKEKRKGRIDSMRAEINRLTGEAGFYLSSAIINHFLREAGEMEVPGDQ